MTTLRILKSKKLIIFYFLFKEIKLTMNIKRACQTKTINWSIKIILIAEILVIS